MRDIKDRRAIFLWEGSYTYNAMLEKQNIWVYKYFFADCIFDCIFKYLQQSVAAKPSEINTKILTPTLFWSLNE